MDAPNTDLKDAVKEHYGAAAARVKIEGKTGCCGPSSCGCSDTDQDPISRDLYDASEIAALPADAVAASLGCGNPTALATLREGDVVLDLGSGGGIDVLLSARRVGPTGKAYGLDMTDEMLALARENQRKSGLTNVEFLRGEIETIPLPDNSVDVIISNCVINLSGDKDRVLREAFRVLKPGGRFAVSDVVRRHDARIPQEVQRNMELWAGCIAGALSDQDYRDKLRAAGFQQIGIEETRVYDAEAAKSFIESAGLDYEAIAAAVDGAFLSAFVRAVKPSA
jgi:ubiquinone/menaquinone biosynthesis C-methylase UbiE